MRQKKLLLQHQILRKQHMMKQKSCHLQLININDFDKNLRKNTEIKKILQ